MARLLGPRQFVVRANRWGAEATSRQTSLNGREVYNTFAEATSSGPFDVIINRQQIDSTNAIEVGEGG
jgi:hypothetical protein